MSLIDKFSVSYKMDKPNRDKAKEMNDSSVKLQVYNRKESFSNLHLSDDILTPLLSFGYTLEQIMIAFKIYKFGTVDEAIYILMKDSDTKKYIHKFIPNSEIKEENKNYEMMIGNCKICGEIRSEHIEFSHEGLDLEIINKKENFIQDENINSNRDKSNLPEANTCGIKHNNKINSDKTQIIHKVEIPKETLDLFENPEICTICFSEILTEITKVNFDCGHNFCKECVTNYLNININNGKVLMIKCLHVGCAKTFIEEEIKIFVSDEIYKKFRKFKISQMKLNNPDKVFINCPFPNCEEIIDLEGMTENDPMTECQQGHKLCAKCKTIGWHKKGKCTNYDVTLLKEIKKNHDSENYRQCPQCAVIIEKNEGCNQMKCLNCNLEFCWLCMKKYSVDHYAIYNFTGCPGMRFNSPRKKKWLNNTCTKTLWFIFSFFLGIFAVILLAFFFFFFGCAYEFVKCYKNHKNRNEEENSYIESEENQENEENEVNEIEENDKWKNKIILSLIIFSGILCQPIYLLFYVLYGMMECYRRFNCWFYYVDY